MTHEQSDRCAALARRIAELDPDWAQPGMACRDGGGGMYRRVGRHTWFAVGAGLVSLTDDKRLAPAVAAGPDWRDAATLGAVLLAVGDVVSINYRAPLWYHRDELRWRLDGASSCGRAGVSGPWCETRAEAILSARLAQLEAK